MGFTALWHDGCGDKDKEAPFAHLPLHLLWGNDGCWSVATSILLAFLALGLVLAPAITLLLWLGWLPGSSAQLYIAGLLQDYKIKFFFLCLPLLSSFYKSP